MTALAASHAQVETTKPTMFHNILDSDDSRGTISHPNLLANMCPNNRQIYHPKGRAEAISFTSDQAFQTRREATFIIYEGFLRLLWQGRIGTRPLLRLSW
jgi:hypothetical protein